MEKRTLHDHMIIGITGPTGAGKDSSASYLAELLGVAHVSGSDVVRGMLSVAGLPVTKDSVRRFSIFLRSQFGPGIIVERALSSANNRSGVIVSGFRSFSEAQIIQDRGGIILYIEASAKVRYERIAARSRQGDPLTRQQFLELDALEQGGDQASDENLGKIKAMADLIVVNEDTIDELHEKLGELAHRTLRTAG